MEDVQDSIEHSESPSIEKRVVSCIGNVDRLLLLSILIFVDCFVVVGDGWMDFGMLDDVGDNEKVVVVCSISLLLMLSLLLLLLLLLVAL